MTVTEDIDLAKLQREAEERAAQNWDPAEAALIAAGVKGQRRPPPAEPDLAALQREAEERAARNWDPDEAIDFVGGPAPITGALVLAIENAAETFIGGANKTPFLGDAYLTTYLRSDHWRALRERMLQRAGGFCSQCRRRSSRLEVHHLTYRNLGQERESELQVLCHDCHVEEHGHGDW